MNVLFFGIRLFVSLVLFLFLIGLLVGKEINVKSVIACIITILFVLFPAMWAVISGRKLLDRSEIKGSYNQKDKLAWFRKGLAVVISIIGMACFNGQDDAVGYAILFVSFIILSPLDAIIFERNEPPVNWSWPKGPPFRSRHVGFWSYFCGVIFLIGESYIMGAIFLVAGLFFIFKPVREYFQPAKITPGYPTDYLFTTPSATPYKFESETNDLRAEYAALFNLDPHARGYAFQDFLNKLFRDLSAKSAFRLTGEEIDGSFEIESQIYLLEAKWQAKPSGQRDLLVFNGKVEGKSTWARGIFINYAGFTEEGLIAFARGKRTSIIGIDGNDLSLILDEKISLVDAIKRKARRAVETNDFFVSLEELL